MATEKLEQTLRIIGCVSIVVGAYVLANLVCLFLGFPVDIRLMSIAFASAFVAFFVMELAQTRGHIRWQLFTLYNGVYYGAILFGAFFIAHFFAFLTD